MVLPGERGPRRVYQGLGIYDLRLTGLQASPTLLRLSPLLLAREAVPQVVVDIRAQDCGEVLAYTVAHGADFPILCRPPRRSTVSSPEVPRAAVALVFPAGPSGRRICL